MGVRLYNPTTGRFLTVDPVYGGNANDYDYCNGDPINCTDLDGRQMCKDCGGAGGGGGTFAWPRYGFWARTVRTFFRTTRRYDGAYQRTQSRRRGFSRRRACGWNNSFTADTLILMATGEARRIDEISIGDVVLAADPSTGEVSGAPVEDIILGSGEKELVDIVVDSDGDGRGEKIIATNEHPIYVARRGWVDAGDLHRGDQTLRADGTRGTVMSTRRYLDEEKVFNLSVGRLHTFFISTSDGSILVHNTSRKCTGFSDHARQRMSERGISEDMVRNTIRTGRRSRGKQAETLFYRGRSVWVVTNSQGRVVSTGWN